MIRFKSCYILRRLHQPPAKIFTPRQHDIGDTIYTSHFFVDSAAICALDEPPRLQDARFIYDDEACCHELPMFIRCLDMLSATPPVMAERHTPQRGCRRAAFAAVIAVRYRAIADI